jgi:hypothetical protein
MLQRIKDNKFIVAVIIGVSVAVDYAFGLGVSQTVIDFFATTPVVVP